MRLPELSLAIALLLATSGVVSTQQQTSLPDFKYQVVSIKPNNSEGDGSLEALPNGLNYKHVTLLRMIRRAYRVETFQVSGEPNWAKTQAFDLEARLDGTAAVALGNLSAEQRELVKEKMLQAVLAERFHLTVRREARQVSVYFLKIADKGTKLEAAKNVHADEALTETTESTVLIRKMHGQSATMASLSSLLSSVPWMSVGRPVIDKTGLTGRYDFNLTWSPGADTPVNADDAEAMHASDASGPSIFVALKEQLGLKLVPGKDDVDFLVIEHVERPSAN